MGTRFQSLTRTWRSRFQRRISHGNQLRILFFQNQFPQNHFQIDLKQILQSRSPCANNGLNIRKQERTCSIRECLRKPLTRLVSETWHMMNSCRSTQRNIHQQKNMHSRCLTTRREDFLGWGCQGTSRHTISREKWQIRMDSILEGVQAYWASRLMDWHRRCWCIHLSGDKFKVLQL